MSAKEYLVWYLETMGKTTLLLSIISFAVIVFIFLAVGCFSVFRAVF